MSLSLRSGTCVALAAPANELTDLEQEIRGFLQNVGEVTTRQDLALLGTLDRRTRSSSVHMSSVRARTEVTPTGTVGYSVGMLGMRASASTGDIESWLPAGTAVNILGFTPTADYVDFGVMRAHAPPGEQPFGPSTFQRAYIRVLPKGSPLTVGTTLVALGVLLDLGSDLDRLIELEREHANLDAELTRLRAGSDVDLGGFRSRLEQLRPVLQKDIRNRREYGTLVRSAPLVLGTLEAELRETMVQLGENPPPISEEVELSTALAGLISHLAGTAAATPEASFEKAKAWARSLSVAIAEIVANRSRCAIVGCAAGERELAEWQGLASEVEKWAAGVEAARSKRCDDSAPMTVDDIEAALAIPAPDGLIAGKIQRCGISFYPEPTVVSRFNARRMGPRTASALREPNVFRASSADLSNRIARLCSSATAALSASLRAAGAGSRAPSPNSAEISLAPQIVTVGDLRWTGSSLGLMSWSDAKKRCEDLTWNGRAWRLPTIEELQALARSGALGFLSSEAQIKILGCCVWSGTSTDRRALSMSVDDGKRDWLSRRLGQAVVLCVS